MGKRQKWLAATIAVVLMISGVSGVSAQTMPDADIIPVQEPAVDRPIMNPTPAMDMPVVEGQDYIEPGVTPVMSRDRALELAQQALKTHMDVDVTQGNFQLNTEYRRDWQQPDRYVWSLYWYLNEPMAYANASVTLDAGTGQILDMNQDRGSYQEPQRSPLTLTREEAKVIGDAFINKLIPGKLAQMNLRDSQEAYMTVFYGGPYQYAFNYVRMIDGIVYDANFANVNVDGSTGEIKWFSQRWEETPDLPDREGIISADQAKDLFSELMQLELFYLPLRSEFMYEPIPKNFRLAYRMNTMMGNMINAKTGKPVDWSGQEDALQMMEKDLTTAQKASISRQAQPVIPSEAPMGQQEAEDLARTFALAFLESDIDIQSINYIEGDQYWESAGRKAWNIDFTVTVPVEEGAGQDAVRKPPYSNGRIMINALTGELIAFNWWQSIEGPYGSTDDPIISWEQGYDIAIETIEKYHPGRINDVRTVLRNMQVQEVMDGQMMKPTEYYYNFPRVIAGVLFDENNLSVNVNARTGKVTNYYDRWSDELTLPRADQVMGAERALELLLANYQLELAYFRYNPSYDYVNPQYETKLVYRWMPRESTANYPYIDATTGTSLDYNGRALPERDAQGFEARITGHWVERTARLMAQQGIIDTAHFSPDEPVTRIDAVKMMVKARGTDYYGPMMDKGGEGVEFVDVPEADEDYRYIEWAIRYGYIDILPEEFQRDANITREEMAVMMARFMGYRQLAEVKDIFRVSYSDAGNIDDSALGAVAINSGLGVISRRNSVYRPKDDTTMAEMVEMLYKAVALQRR
ncbi:MAG: S-layer homology domain-containing protein [Bacillota bacterium]|nr:S-layer homology domain-containing protein [Bacillota bacterium]MDW7676525.1 S-layer homology domain-containing protein [Bacillota bacterium]